MHRSQRDVFISMMNKIASKDPKEISRIVELILSQVTTNIDVSKYKYNGAKVSQDEAAALLVKGILSEEEATKLAIETDEDTYDVKTWATGFDLATDEINQKGLDVLDKTKYQILN